VRGVVAPPGIPEENVRYWQDVFQRLTRTESWKRFLVEKHFEDGYQQGPELLTFLDEFNERTRGVLARAGVKTVR
jgi:putative tricarboxylic transport membrane protein